MKISLVSRQFVVLYIFHKKHWKSFQKEMNHYGNKKGILATMHHLELFHMTETLQFLDATPLCSSITIHVEIFLSNVYGCVL
jgi:hypothetical protein